MAAQAKKSPKKKKSGKKREKILVPIGVVHINATFNNTMITMTDPTGNVIATASSGAQGFRGSRKGTPFAAQQAAQKAVEAAREVGMKTVNVLVKGPGSGRESAIRKALEDAEKARKELSEVEARSRTLLAEAQVRGEQMVLTRFRLHRDDWAASAARPAVTCHGFDGFRGRVGL